MPPPQELWTSDSESDDDNSIDQQVHQQVDMEDMPMQWQSDLDFPYREHMVQTIVKILTQLNKNASPEWKEKLPLMVEQLESALYTCAPTFEAYVDEQTLKNRLQSLAMDLSEDIIAADSEFSRECEEMLDEKFDHFSFDD